LNNLFDGTAIAIVIYVLDSYYVGGQYCYNSSQITTAIAVVCNCVSKVTQKKPQQFRMSINVLKLIFLIKKNKLFKRK